MGNGAKILKNYEHSNYEVQYDVYKVGLRRERERVKDIFYEERERERREENKSIRRR